MKPSAVIGLGAVSCFGQTADSFADAIFAGRCGIGDITDMVPPTISVRIGVRTAVQKSATVAAG